MAEEQEVAMENTTDEVVMRVYEIGYHITPNIKEEDIEKVVSGIRSEIEKHGGSFIAEGAPSMARLSYSVEAREGGKRVEHDRAYFGWLKFEAKVSAAKALDEVLKENKSIIRFILFKTVREDTRAKMKAPTVREVKRTDIIKAAPRRAEESAAPVSEEDLEKAISEITAD